MVDTQHAPTPLQFHRPLVPTQTSVLLTISDHGAQQQSGNMHHPSVSRKPVTNNSKQSNGGQHSNANAEALLNLTDVEAPAMLPGGTIISSDLNPVSNSLQNTAGKDGHANVGVTGNSGSPAWRSEAFWSNASFIYT